MGEHRILSKMWGRIQSTQVQRAEKLWRVGRCFLPPLSPCLLPDFVHKAKMTISSPGALEPGSKLCQDTNGCCLYSVLWCYLYSTDLVLLPLVWMSLSLNEFNSIWSDPSPTLGYLIVVMSICVLKTAMALCSSIFARDTMVKSAEWHFSLMGRVGKY